MKGALLSVCCSQLRCQHSVHRCSGVDQFSGSYAAFESSLCIIGLSSVARVPLRRLPDGPLSSPAFVAIVTEFVVYLKTSCQVSEGWGQVGRPFQSPWRPVWCFVEYCW